MSKKTAKVTSVSEEPKKELIYLSNQLKIESPSSKLSSISSKEEFETLFQEYNKYFIMIGHEITNLDIINEELKNYISLIQKSFNDKFGEPESDGDFSGLDDEDDDNESVASDNSSVPPEPEGGGKKKKAVVKQSKKVEEDSDDGNESPMETAPKKLKDKKVTVKTTKSKKNVEENEVEEVIETKSKKETKAKAEEVIETKSKKETKAKVEKVEVNDKKKKSKKDE